MIRAIDLYSGIGGWTIGLACAGIEVIASYERASAAARTARRNLGAVVHEVDLLTHDPENFPKGVSLVVGSPPCTEFSFSNRGGGGDIANGLNHVVKFLKIVEHIQPRFWVIENVPRLASILFVERNRYRRLWRFNKILAKADFRIIDASEYGLPQRRLRCIIGNIPFDLLSHYRQRCKRLTLGEVVNGLERDPVIDPNFGLRMRIGYLTEHEKEASLDWEERRINREAKEHHPVYNRMPFPDCLDRPVRTITATCTRVGRESIVIRDTIKARSVRRLTIRERAVLQGFPITYQLLGGGNGEKLRLVGNAMPPPISYYIGKAILKTPAARVKPIAKNGPLPFDGLRANCMTKPIASGNHYPSDRRFRFAVSGMRFKSGVRFDLCNRVQRRLVRWSIEFYFGQPKDIRSIVMNSDLTRRASAAPSLEPALRRLAPVLRAAVKDFSTWSSTDIQESWVSKKRGRSHPFAVIDKISGLVVRARQKIKPVDRTAIEEFVIELARPKSKAKKLLSEAKLRKHAVTIFCGLLIGSLFNEMVDSGALRP